MNVIDSLLYKVDIVDLVQKYTELHEDSSGNYRGKCPIHSGNNPSSLIVYPDGRYYCFSCNSYGNAINFYQNVENLAFYQAVERLCDIYEVSTDDETYKKQKSIVGNNARMSVSFQSNVGEIEEYLMKRGFTKDTIQEFGIGYDKGGFIISDSPGIIIPIQDVYGRIVGFSKRRIDDKKPKYKNTPDNDVFKKGSILFNLNRAAKIAKRDGVIHLVEGYMDVMSAHQQGIACVGYMSSKPTKNQVLLLKELASRIDNLTIVLAVDNPDIDDAGKESLPRIRNMFIKYAPNLNIRCIVYPKE